MSYYTDLKIPFPISFTRDLKSGSRMLLIRLETKSCRILYCKLIVKYDRT